VFPGEAKHEANRSGRRTNSFRLCVSKARTLLGFGLDRGGFFMKTTSRYLECFRRGSRRADLAIALLAMASPAFAQTGASPWENAVTVLQTAFTSTIARGLSLVAIVVAGLTFAFGEGGSKRVLAGVLFGVGMAIAAVNFLAWLFPGN
jgi:type IV secretion system protein TrbC